MTAVLVLPPHVAAQRDLDDAHAAWVDGLPRLAASVLAEWALTAEGVARGGMGGLVLPVVTAGEGPTVRLALKFAFPADAAGEAALLQRWGGYGAVELVRADPRRGVLLLERLGRPLATVDDLGSCTEVARLCRLLHRPAAPQVASLHTRVLAELDALEALGRGVPAPPRFVEQALAVGRRLASAPATHLVHGDLHGGNVLWRARTREWVAVDPRGGNADPCFEPASVLWQRWDDLEATGNVGGAIRDRFYAVVDGAGLDERRARDWVVVRAVLNVGWLAGEARRSGRPLDAGARQFVTRSVTVAKAMQDVRP